MRLGQSGFSCVWGLGEVVIKYSEKLKDPRWQRLLLQVFERDEWVCQSCFDGDATLCVHHLRYIPNKEPWDYPVSMLLTLCESCHSREYEGMQTTLGSLCEEVRDKGLLSPAVHEITQGFHALVDPKHPATPSVIRFFLTNHEAFQCVWDLYFKKLEERRDGMV